MSPVEAARQTIGQGMSAQEYGARFFGQGASLSGVIEVPGTLEDKAARELAKRWSRDHSGPRKANLPGVLEGGAVWKPTGVTNEQAQFLETRKFAASEIASQMFLIDPAEMGLPVDGSSLTYANLEQRNARKVQVTYLPWMVRLERFISALLPTGQYAKFNVKGLLRGDTKTQYESYEIGKEPVPHQRRDPKLGGTALAARWRRSTGHGQGDRGNHPEGLPRRRRDDHRRRGEGDREPWRRCLPPRYDPGGSTP